MSFYGADVEALEALKGQTIRAADRLGSIRTQLASVVASSTWQGPDAERFRSDWSSRHVASLQSVAARLVDAADALARNTREQREASSDVGADSAASGAAPVPAHHPAAMPPAEVQEWLLDRLDYSEFDDADGTREAVEGATDQELTILGGLVRNGLTAEQMVQVLKGAHVWVEGSALYDEWKHLPGSESRTSSHYGGENDGSQRHIDGPLSTTMLFGEARKGTWIQLERYSTGGHVNQALHMVAYAQYQYSGENQGPHGSSPSTEAHPIELGGTRPDAEPHDLGLKDHFNEFAGGVGRGAHGGVGLVDDLLGRDDGESAVDHVKEVAGGGAKGAAGAVRAGGDVARKATGWVGDHLP